MKSKKAHKTPEPEPVLDEGPIVVELPIFSSDVIRARASPSAFASVLVDDAESVRSPKSSSSRDKDKDQTAKFRSRKGKEVAPPSASPLSASRGFAFDVPSPDDIVFNARKGSSLAQRPLASSSN